MTAHADAHGTETSRRLRVLALVAVGVLVAAYLILVLTPLGQSWDDAALVGRLRERAADRAEVGRFLKSIDTVTLVLMVVVVAVVGLVRRRARLALLAGGAFFAAVLSAELLKAVLPRPSYGTELAILASKDYDTYPSGHATIATGFVLALVMVNNNRWRPLIALLGVLWSSAIATGVVAAGWHRPSDAIGGIALATAWLAASAALLSRERGLAAEPGRLARALPAIAVTLGLLVVVTAVVLALTSSQARQPADVPWWAFPIGQITIDLTAIAAVGTYAWLLKDLRFGDPRPRTPSDRALPLPDRDAA
jgi:membrane-associated phospholipid phosphatase